ncbi:hypothetical protein D1872_293760 [compost metagenome]
MRSSPVISQNAYIRTRFRPASFCGHSYVEGVSSWINQALVLIIIDHIISDCNESHSAPPQLVICCIIIINTENTRPRQEKKPPISAPRLEGVKIESPLGLLVYLRFPELIVKMTLLDI